MRTRTDDPLHRAAEQVADRLSEDGYAFVEDDQVNELAGALRAFLIEHGIVARPANRRKRRLNR